jgi:hypothetical protein
MIIPIIPVIEMRYRVNGHNKLQREIIHANREYIQPDLDYRERNSCPAGGSITN